MGFPWINLSFGQDIFLASKLSDGYAACMSLQTAAARVEKTWKKLVEAKTQLAEAIAKKDDAQRDYDEAYAAFNGDGSTAKPAKVIFPTADEASKQVAAKSEPKKASKPKRAESSGKARPDGKERSDEELADDIRELNETNKGLSDAKKAKWLGVTPGRVYRVRKMFNIRGGRGPSLGTPLPSAHQHPDKWVHFQKKLKGKALIERQRAEEEAARRAAEKEKQEAAASNVPAPVASGEVFSQSSSDVAPVIDPNTPAASPELSQPTVGIPLPEDLKPYFGEEQDLGEGRKGCLRTKVIPNELFGPLKQSKQIEEVGADRKWYFITKR